MEREQDDVNVNADVNVNVKDAGGNWLARCAGGRKLAEIGIAFSRLKGEGYELYTAGWAAEGGSTRHVYELRIEEVFKGADWAARFLVNGKTKFLLRADTREKCFRYGFGAARAYLLKAHSRQLKKAGRPAPLSLEEEPAETVERQSEELH